MKTPTERDIRRLLLELKLCEPEARADFEAFKRDLVLPHIRTMHRIIGSQLRKIPPGEKREIILDLPRPRDASSRESVEWP